MILAPAQPRWICGAPAGYSANVVQLYWNGSAIYQRNSAGGWWSWSGSDWVDAASPTSSSTTATSPTSTPTPSPSSTSGTSSGTPSTPGAPITYQAEAMSLAGGYVVDSSSIKLGGATTGTATQTFGGASGTYNVQVYVELENNGTPNLKLYRGSALLADYTYPLGANGQVASFSVNGVSLVKGDTLKLSGTANAGALARVDKIVLTPIMTTTTTGTTGTTSGTTTSAAGTSVPPAAQIVDASKAVWTVNAGVVYRNGARAGYSANVVQLYWNGSAIYQRNSAGGWWSWNGSDWADAANPTSSSTGTASNTPPSTTPPSTSSLPSTGTRAVATFESLGLYWTPPANPGSAGCEVQYQKTGDTTWKKGLNLWYDSRNGECRGSLVMLAPNTEYQVQFAMPGTAPVAGLVAKTWSESFPIARTVYVSSGSSTLNITQGGTAGGYVLYAPAPGTTATIDAANNALHNISISAPYVIIRGLTLKGAQGDAIDIADGAHDLVIEDNDISGWGRYSYTNSAGWQIGDDYDSGIHAHCPQPPNRGASVCATPMERLVIQRNKIHDPRYGANSWSWGHPAGPQGTSFSFIGGNHVIRYNEIYSTGGVQHYFNDGIGGEDQDCDAGFPNYDSDIYGNKVSQVWDDAIETEGADQNVRIWGNYIDQVTVGIATATVNRGPIYVFRNVQNRSRQMSERALDDDDRNTFSKSGRDGTFHGGRRYLFHNTTLQASGSGATNGLGVGAGVSTPDENTVSRNNIWQIWKSWWSSISTPGGSNDDFDYDLFNGNINAYAGAEPHGIVGTPIYQSGNGWQSESGGMYQLAPNSPGYDRGVVLPNFNDGFTGAAPDMGAHEAGTPAMKFGVTAGTKEY